MKDQDGGTDPSRTSGAGSDATKRARRIAALLAELRHQGIRDERVLATLARVPRERFVLPTMQAEAWANVALPIGAGQTISQPYVVAIMTLALGLRGGGGERVLEVGTGSGYQAAILCEAIGPNGLVVSIERHARLAAEAAARLAALGYRNAEIHVADGSTGWPEGAPYDGIMVTAAGPEVPAPLLDQLAPTGGRLVMPIGRHDDAQELILVERDGAEARRQSLGPVRFVPLVGREGWAAIRENGHRPKGSGVGGPGSE
jgi:protein-L-isoaspartate(D-aspartate) O-methyltransferase